MFVQACYTDYRRYDKKDNQERRIIEKKQKP